MNTADNQSKGLWACPDHSALMQTVGEIKGTQHTLMEWQLEIKGKLDELLNKISDMQIHIATDETRIKPIYWVLGVLGVAVIAEIVRGANWVLSNLIK